MRRRTSRGGGEGEEGCRPPSYRNFWNISGKTLMIRAKVLGRNVVKARLQGYFLWRVPCQDGVKVKWSKDPGISFGKAIYRLHVYRRNPRDERRTRRPTTSDKTCWDTLQKYLTLTKMLTVANWKTVSPLPYCNVVYGHRRNAHLGC